MWDRTLQHKDKEENRCDISTCHPCAQCVSIDVSPSRCKATSIASSCWVERDVCCCPLVPLWADKCPLSVGAKTLGPAADRLKSCVEVEVQADLTPLNSRLRASMSGHRLLCCCRKCAFDLCLWSKRCFSSLAPSAENLLSSEQLRGEHEKHDKTKSRCFQVNYDLFNFHSSLST